jgi:hypothetical protein
MKTQKRSFVTTIMAGMFALLWIAGGVAAPIIASDKERGWIVYLLSPFAIAYGLVWVLVMLHGRQLRRGETSSGLRALAQMNFSHFRERK